MIPKFTKKLLENTKKEMLSLNDEYEKMVIGNKSKSMEINNSIQKKLKEFNELKQEKSKHFNFIRNK